MKNGLRRPRLAQGVPRGVGGALNRPVLARGGRAAGQHRPQVQAQRAGGGQKLVPHGQEEDANDGGGVLA